MKNIKTHINTIVTVITLISLIVGGTLAVSTIVVKIDDNGMHIEDIINQKQEDIYIYGVGAVDKFLPYIDDEVELQNQLKINSTNRINLVRACNDRTVKGWLIDDYGDEVIRTLCLAVS